MVIFDFPEKDLALVFPPHFVYDFSRKIKLIKERLTDCLYFSSFWAICVLQLFANQAVTS